MTPKSKKALIVIVSLLAIGGGVGYFLWKRKKDKDAEAEAKVKADADAAAAAAAAANQSGGGSGSGSGSGSGGGSGSGSGSSSTYTFPFKTEAEGNAFRAWVNKKDPAYAKSIDLSLTGKLNSFVQKAWDKYGTEYTKPLPKTALDGTPLEQVIKNLGKGVYPIQVFTDRVTATIKTTDDNKVYQGVFYSNGRYFLFRNGKSLQNGYWSDGGKTITLSNKRIISSGSVWANIRTSVGA